MLRNPHIIIVGAGISGIATARRLFDHGYTKLTILEAENRIGGRINTVKFFDDTLIEIGAQWCHGEGDNVIYNLVKDLTVLGASAQTFKDFTFYDFSGNKIDKALSGSLFEICEEIVRDVQAVSKEEGSIGDYFIRRYNPSIEKMFSNNRSSLKTALGLREWYRNLTLLSVSATSWFDVSAPGALEYRFCEGNQQLHWSHYGFRTILDILMKSFPDKSEKLPIFDQILFNKVVENIKWDDDEVIVKCNDGTAYTGDHVVCTTSLGVLKERHKEMFTPELPLDKINAIEGLGMGVVNKIFLRFSKKWWPDDCTGFSLIWNEEDKLNIANEFPEGFLKDGKLWLESIFGFYVIDSDPNTLLGWSVGPLAQHIELLPDDVVLNGCTYILNKFLNKTYPDIPAPVKMTRSKWHSNKHFRGSYSYRTVDSHARNVSAKDLAKPLKGKSGKCNLLFAGEATHDHFYSTAHGALETGFREADRIIELYK